VRFVYTQCLSQDLCSAFGRPLKVSLEYLALLTADCIFMTTERTVTDIFRKHYGELRRYIQFRFARAGEADDIVQDAFQNILKLDSIENIENPRAYLYQAAKNIALNRIRQRQSQQGVFVELDDQLSTDVELIHQIIADSDAKRVKRAIESLSEKDRTTFLMNRVQGKGYKDISEELGISVSAVEKRMMKVLVILRRTLDEQH
jgi:RNA polymerase sigma factor (sigma-70 family)